MKLGQSTRQAVLSGKVVTLLALGLGISIAVTGSFGFVNGIQAKEVMGKVMAVYHEPVVVNTKIMDKVSVTVASCPSGKFETVSYNPGSVSDDNSLGFLFTHLTMSARSTVQKNQYMNMVSGHASFDVNDNNVIQKTTFWGYNWECGRNLDGAPPSSGASATPSTSPPASGGSAPAKNEGLGKKLIKNRLGL